MQTLSEKVRVCDIDSYGIMHHSIYFQLYENGIMHYLKQMNIEEKYPVIKSSDIKYVNPVHMEDEVQIITELKEISEADESYIFKQRILVDEKVVNKGIIKVVLSNLKNGDNKI